MSEGVLVSPRRSLALAKDVGILDKLQAKWWGQGSASCSTSSQAFNTLGFSKVVFAFLMLGLGMLAGWIVLLAEIWLEKALPSSSSTSSSSSSSAFYFLKQFFRSRQRHKRSRWGDEGRQRGKGRDGMGYKSTGAWAWFEEAGHTVGGVEPYLPHLKHLPPPPPYAPVQPRY